MKTCIIFNPVARGDKARRFREQIVALSGECALKPTTGPGAGRTLAAEAVREGFETVVAAGGDGTLNEVVNGLADVPEGLAKVKLGILPLGTVNVFAREVGLPLNPLRAWEVVRVGRTRTIDLAAADFIQDGRPTRRYFVQMAGAGLDARAVELVDWEHKKLLGPLAYVIACLKAMHGPLPQIVATVGNQSCGGELVLIGNGRFYGGRFVLFPTADLCDGLLEVTVFPRTRWAATLRVGANVLMGQSPAAGQTLTLRGRCVRLTAADRVPFQVEGEAAGELPVTFSVQPGALRAIVP